MLKKILSMVISVIMLATLFTACGGSNQIQQNQGSETAAAASSQPGSTVASDGNDLPACTIKFWFPSEGQATDQYLTSVPNDFTAQYPQIKVEVTKLPTNVSDINLKLNAAQMSNDFPDVFSAYTSFMGNRGANGDFEDLTPYIDKWEDKDDIIAGAMDVGTYRDKRFGIGYLPATYMTVYRTDYFKEAGLDPTKPPTNWDELRDYAYKLVKKDSSGKVTRAGFDIPALQADTLVVPFIRMGGSAYFDNKNEKCAFTDQGAADALTFLTSMKDQSIPYDHEKLEDYPFMKGNAAMSTLRIAQYNNLLARDPSMKDKVAIAPVLKQVNQVAYIGYRIFTMGSTSKYKDQSWEFIKFMMGKDQMLKRAKDLRIPVVRKSLESDYIALDPQTNEFLEQYVQLGKNVPVVSWNSVITKYVRIAYEEVYTGKKPAEQALKDADATINKEVESLFKK